MWKRLFSWMFKIRSDEDQPLGLQDLLQEVLVVRKTLRKHTVILEEVQQGLASLADREAKKEIEPLLGCADAIFHLGQSLRAKDGFSPQLDQALRIVWEKVDDVLDAAGVAMIRDQNVIFDARRHEVIERTGMDSGQPLVLRVVQPGYSLEGRVIRAAKTIVGSYTSASQDSEGRMT
jgi:molecular chaperone GrpE (heat shock protein)